MSKIQLTRLQVALSQVATEAPKDVFRKLMLNILSLCPLVEFLFLPCSKLPQVVLRLFNEGWGDVELQLVNPKCNGIVLASLSRTSHHALFGNVLLKPTMLFVKPTTIVVNGF